MGGGPGAYGDLVIHPLEPIFDAGSSVLVLGTMPSPASRSSGFYYMHPQNRFWPVLAGVFEPARLAAGRVPETVAERRAFALKHGVALWDVLYSLPDPRSGGQHDPGSGSQRPESDPRGSPDPDDLHHRPESQEPLRPVLPDRDRTGSRISALAQQRQLCGSFGTDAGSLFHTENS